MPRDSIKRGSIELPDKVVPLGVFDDTAVKQPIIIYSTLLFNEVLDVPKLRNSLERLIEQDGWDKLGARLRRNVGAVRMPLVESRLTRLIQPATGRLEHHIPSQFTKARPAIRFHHIKHDMARFDHPIGSKFPGPTTIPTISVDPDTCQPLWIDPNAPTKVQHYLQDDGPQLGLVIASFHDATIVSLSWTHSLFDAMGLGELLHAWSLMLQGRRETIGKPFGTEHDPLAQLGRNASKHYRLGSARLSLLGYIVFVCRTLVTILLYRQYSRMLYVPGPFIQRLREEAIGELPYETEEGASSFLSDGDVLCAWWTKISASHLSGSNKVVNLSGALGWRGTLVGDLLSIDRPYISNAFGFFSVLAPAKDIVAKPVGSLARKIRQSITESRQRDQIESYAALWRKSRDMSFPLFGKPTMHMMVCSNWSKAKLFDLDFSAAVVRKGTALTTMNSGRPSYIQSCFRGVNLANFMVIVGKDSSGGYWLTATTHARHWAWIGRAITQAGEI